ncbi:MAG: hypothetical protein ABSE85_17765, partial [Candidatus Korobacteraceae bacterium]
MENKTSTPLSLKRAVQPGTAPTVLNKVAKPCATATVGGREMENKTPTPTALKRAVQPSTTPSALNKVAKPETTKPLLEKHERTGAKVMVHRAGTTVSVPQAVKPDVPSSAGNRAEKPGAQTAKSFEVVKGAVDARSKREDKKPYVKPTSPRK